ncbi:MAG TPA: acyl carrier protein [Steroidobacter sp.]
MYQGNVFHWSKLPLRLDIERRVTAVIARELVTDQSCIVPSARLSEDLGADSLDLVEIVMALEDQLGLEISDDDAERLTTVQHAIDYVAYALQNRSMTTRVEGHGDRT